MRTLAHDNRGFTLIELMISIALVLLLMIGINQVFKVTGEAVGTGMAVGTAVRDARGAQGVFTSDFDAWDKNSPGIVIHSERVSAFRNRADQEADLDYQPGSGTLAIDQQKRTVDIDGNGREGEPAVPGELIPPAIYNDRSHRIDKVSFFASGVFRRQTGGTINPSNPNLTIEEYVADMSSRQAWVWYGHLKRPDPTSTAAPLNQLEVHEYRNPGQEPDPTAAPPDNNPDNYYVNDWILGRMAVLLAGADTDGDELYDQVVDRRDPPRPQRFIERKPTHPLTDDSVIPLRDDARSNDGGPTALARDQWQLRSARYDIAGTDIGQFARILQNNVILMPAEPWYTSMMGWRFHGDPTPERPLSPKNVSRTTPVFLEHCSQFIVEYAGDFLEQSNGSGIAPNTTQTGYLVDKTVPPDPATGAYGPDGEIDYIWVDPDGTANNGDEYKRIRWYGMPRDVSSPGTPGSPDGIILSSLNLAGGGNPNLLIDVVPLQDLLDTATPAFVWMPPAANPEQRFIERKLPRLPMPFYNPMPGAPPPTYANLPMPGLPAMGPNDEYIIAWGPDTVGQPRPMLIRIVFTIEDPTGRLATGQTYEYVFRAGS